MSTTAIAATASTVNASSDAPSACAASQLTTNYRACRCIGVMAGRACPACNQTKFQRRCQPCNGSGKLFINSRPGTSSSLPRAEVHSPCMGRGWLPCQPSDLEAIAELTELAEMEAEDARKAARAGAGVGAATPSSTPAGAATS